MSTGSFERDFQLAKAILEELDPYLLSPHLFWPITGRFASRTSATPQLTPGLILLTLDRLDAGDEGFSEEQRASVARVWEQFDEILSARRSALEKKALQEISQRLRLWRDYLKALSARGRGMSEYRTQVRNRVIFTRLTDWITAENAIAAEEAEMAQLDRQLRSGFKAGPFMWEDRLKEKYPQERFWFLYGEPLGTTSRP